MYQQKVKPSMNDQCMICRKYRKEHKSLLSHQFLNYYDRICKKCHGLEKDHHIKTMHKFTPSNRTFWGWILA